MPDWSYHVLFKPILFAMPPERARDLTLAASGTIASLPGGSQLIDFLGHMRPSEELRVPVLGRSISSPIGLGAGLTTNVDSLRALSRFGFGFIELGAVAAQPYTPDGKVRREVRTEAILYPDEPECENIDEFVRKSLCCGLAGASISLRSFAACHTRTAIEL